jgi:hypothetical protein
MMEDTTVTFRNVPLNKKFDCHIRYTFEAGCGERFVSSQKEVEMRKRLIVSVLGLALVLGMIGGAQAITNGQPDGNGHPYVGLVVSYFQVGSDIVPMFCNGSLITPTLVLTAGHCTFGAMAARVWFDEVIEGNPDFPDGGYDGTPHTHPDWCWGCGNGLPGFDHRDVAVVVLSKPAVPDCDVGRCAALPDSGLVDRLMKKAPIDIVGYGVQNPIPPKYSYLHNRYYAFSEIISVKFKNSDEFIRIKLNPGGGSGGTCHHDSGGPALLGDTNTILAVNTAVVGSGMNCNGVGYSTRVDIPGVLNWIKDCFIEFNNSCPYQYP